MDGHRKGEKGKINETRQRLRENGVYAENEDRRCNFKLQSTEIVIN